MQRLHRFTSGFTLVELLVALVIVALIMSAAFGALRIGSRSYAAGVARADAIESFRVSTGFLRRQLAAARTVVISDTAGERLLFSGTAERVRFIAPAPLASTGAALFTYTLATDVTAGELQISYQPFDPGQPTLGRADDAGAVRVSGAFDAAVIDYFGAAGERDTPHWQPHWPAAADRLPEILRIRFTPAEATPSWPDMVLPLRAGGAP